MDHMEQIDQQALEQLSNKINKLAREIERLTHTRRRLEKMRSLIRATNPKPFELASECFDLKRHDAELATELREIFSYAISLAVGELRKYQPKLQHELQGEGLTVEGSQGEYKVDNLIDVKIIFNEDEGRCEAEIRTCSRCAPIRLKGDISPEKVAHVISQHMKRLKKDRFKDAEFIELLEQAYDNAVSTGGPPQLPEKPVPIMDVYRHFLVLLQRERSLTDITGKSFNFVPLDEFVMAIGRLLANNVTRAHDGRMMKLHPERNPRDSIAITNLATGTRQNYGQISFIVKATEGGNA